MSPAVEQLVRETIEATGASRPALLDDDAPVLAEDALDLSGQTPFYFVGIIGGKEVGKSALVNALAGRNITAITSHGPGTEDVVAYAHHSQEAAVQKLLQREAPGKFRIVTHDEPRLSRQVLLDLPDIDSHWQSHLLVTRAMLRHMLYPVWVQSIEKYADRQPQEMLRRVAEGNVAANFMFCLNKVDQLRGETDAAEIMDDFGRRISQTLNLSSPPQVFAISALQPERFDFPRLRQTLMQERAVAAVRESKTLAARRQDQSLLSWLDAQRLSDRSDGLRRLMEDARETLQARVGEPLLETAVPRILRDPANRLEMSDDILRRRVARWPLVNLVHTLLSPLLMVWRRNVAPAMIASVDRDETLVGAHIDSTGRPMAQRVQSAFAQLRQSTPAVAELYSNNHLWEDLPAESAAGDLRRRLASVVARQREQASNRIAGRHGIISPLFRWLLTIGALLWFPFIQPVLEGFLNDQTLRIGAPDFRRLIGLAVSVFSGEALLKNTTFLLIWFTVIWAALRWNTQRRVARILAKWTAADYPDPSLNLTLQSMEWMNELLAPIEQARSRMTSLSDRADELRRSLPASSAA